MLLLLFLILRLFYPKIYCVRTLQRCLHSGHVDKFEVEVWGPRLEEHAFVQVGIRFKTVYSLYIFWHYSVYACYMVKTEWIWYIIPLHLFYYSMVLNFKISPKTYWNLTTYAHKERRKVLEKTCRQTLWKAKILEVTIKCLNIWKVKLDDLLTIGKYHHGVDYNGESSTAHRCSKQWSLLKLLVWTLWVI